MCYFCNRKKNEIVLTGRLKGDAVWDMTPCDKCAKCMKMGIIFISVRDGETGTNPYRTGGWCVVKEDATKRMVTTPEVLDNILGMRAAFIPNTIWKRFNLDVLCEKPMKGKSNDTKENVG